MANEGFSATCSYYDRSGRGVRSSEPFFLNSTTGASAPSFATQLNPCGTAAALWTTQTYDVLGRPLTTVAPDTSTVSHKYTGLTTELTDQLGRASTQVKNALGELLTATDAANLTITYSYDAVGNLIKASRNAGRGVIETTFGYDTRGRKEWQDDPDAGYWSYTYNAAGELLTQTDANGQSIRQDFDARGRVWRKRVYADGGALESTSTWVFDTASNGIGAPASVTMTGAGALTRTYSYDVLGRASQVESSIDGLNYREASQYDSLGRAYKQLDASGRWSKTQYTARGFVERVCDSTAADTTAACTSFHLQVERADARGNVVRDRRENSIGPATARSFDSYTGRPSTVCTGPGADPDCSLQNDVYHFDVKGNLLKRERNVASPASNPAQYQYIEHFRYDQADRLTLGWYEHLQGEWFSADPPVVDPAASAPVNLSFWAEYDSLGNLCRKNMLGLFANYGYQGRAGCGLSGLGGSGNNSSVGAHRITSLSAPSIGLDVPISHDGNGNHEFAGTGSNPSDKTYGYTAQNQASFIRIGSQSAPSRRAQFWYGPEGQRYKRVDDGTAHGTLATTITYLGSVEREVQGATVRWRRLVAGVVLQESTGEATVSGYAGAAGAVGTGRVVDRYGLGGRSRCSNGTRSSLVETCCQPQLLNPTDQRRSHQRASHLVRNPRLPLVGHHIAPVAFNSGTAVHEG